MSKLFRRFGVAAPAAVMAVIAVAVVASVPAIAEPIANATGLTLPGVNKTAKKALKLAKKANKRAMTPGPKGDKGDTGARGLQGLQGPAGDDGTDGTNGTNGVSVTSANEPAGANCSNGGSKFTAVSGVTYACNGADGADGGDALPTTLPAGSTLTGAWSFGLLSDTTSPAAFASISFPVPLASADVPDGAETHFIGTDGNDTSTGNPAPACPGTPADPQADPGHVCMYATNLVNSVFAQIVSGAGSNLPDFAGGVGTAGGFIQFGLTGSPAFGAGTFAVTAP